LGNEIGIYGQTGFPSNTTALEDEGNPRRDMGISMIYLGSLPIDLLVV
jgi:hypothetical protein